MELRERVSEWIDAHKDELINTLCESLRIPSVKGEAEEGAPFGREVTRAIEHALEAGRRYGLKTRNMEGYIGLIDHGDGEETLGVMCHMDVVPEGEGWTFPPYGGVVHGGEIHGRGALDDKGPAICALYALAAIKECGLPMKRRVRIMLGGDEESGWGCMKYYGEHERFPELAFSPDAEYPLVNSEKGIAQCTLGRKYASRLRIEAGSRPNVVCESATVKLELPVEEVRSSAERVEEAGFAVEVCEVDGLTVATVKGIAAHASMPEQGRNAIQGLLMLLAALPLADEDMRCISALHEAFRLDMHGESAGIDCADQSGRLTVNPGVLNWDESGFALVVDMRVPTTFALRDAVDGLNAAIGVTALMQEHFQEGHFVPRDSELVTKLLEVYERRTGERAEPLAIGGGTYARAVENAVAFGCERPGVPALIHMPNESIRIEDVMFNAHMLADAMIALACE
ncbi:MAG: Sapep family Mn(2+)-dependent dipeptidase [Clostridia bacterium]|nr:Sapep family Mn(2+)-dependent dipeptidase [Clostridia bacterium]